MHSFTVTLERLSLTARIRTSMPAKLNAFSVNRQDVRMPETGNGSNGWSSNGQACPAPKPHQALGAYDPVGDL